MEFVKTHRVSETNFLFEGQEPSNTNHSTGSERNNEKMRNNYFYT